MAIHKFRGLSLPVLLLLSLILLVFQEAPAQAFGPVWTPPSTNPEYYYARSGTSQTDARTDPINIVVTGPAGTLDNLKNRLITAGKWKVLDKFLACYSTIYFQGKAPDLVMATDTSDDGTIVGFSQCGSGTRNHFRAWKQVDSLGNETIFIAASFETLVFRPVVPPPSFSITNSTTDYKLYYRGRVDSSDPNAVGTYCGNSSNVNVSYNWHFTAIVPTNFVPVDLKDNYQGTWHIDLSACDSASHWPMKIVQSGQSATANQYEIYVAPWDAAPTDQNPRGNNPASNPHYTFYLTDNLNSINIVSCGAPVHCLTEDSFNQGREDLWNAIYGVLSTSGVDFTVDNANNLGNNALITQDKFSFKSDGYARVFNITSLTLNYTGMVAPSVGTNCSTPTNLSGVTQNFQFTLSGVPSGYTPKFLINNGGGVWRNSSLGCSSNGNWPMLVQSNGNGSWTIKGVPYGPVPGGGQPGYYTLFLNTGAGAQDDPATRITAKIMF